MKKQQQKKKAYLAPTKVQGGLRIDRRDMSATNELHTYVCTDAHTWQRIHTSTSRSSIFYFSSSSSSFLLPFFALQASTQARTHSPCKSQATQFDECLSRYHKLSLATRKR